MTGRRAMVIACLIATAACDCGARPLAVLTRHEGDVARDHRAKVGTWEPAAEGATFALGDGLKTGEAATAELRTHSSTRLQVEPGTIVRFAASRPKAPPKVALEMGAIRVEAAEEDLEVDTRRGTARIVAGTRTRVRARDGRVRFDVEVGRVVVETADGARDVGAGRSFELMVGPAIREVDPADEGGPLGGAPVGSPPTDGTAVDAGAADAGRGLSGGAPLAGAAGDVGAEGGRPRAQAGSRGQVAWLLADDKATDLSLDTDVARATIHAPDGRARIRLPFPCAGAGSLEVRRGKRWLRHPASAPVAVDLGPGSYAYRVRCTGDSKPALSGRLMVRRDAGVRRLPRRPAEATARADGRRYTIRYQNQLPTLSLTWPDAPKATAYTVTLKSKAGVRTRRGKGPRVRFRSGSVAEGRYTFFFAAGGKRSPTTDLVIAFDNAARAASLSTPAPTGYAAGPTVNLAGVAMVGARVSVGGMPVPLRGDGRFNMELPTPNAALAVRVSHPKGGVHYYLRRPR